MLDLSLFVVERWHYPEWGGSVLEGRWYILAPDRKAADVYAYGHFGRPSRWYQGDEIRVTVCPAKVIVVGGDR